MNNKCKYCNYCKENYKTVWKHQNKCIYKPTFLDKYYDNIISNEILKKEHSDIKYIATKTIILHHHIQVMVINYILKYIQTKN